MRRLAGLGVFAFALTSGVGRADIDLPTVPTAQPEPVTVKVFVGESVDIPLRGVSRSGQPLEFLIRRQPEAGKLSRSRRRAAIRRP